MGQGMFSEMQVLLIEDKKKEENFNEKLLEVLGCEVEISNNA